MFIPAYVLEWRGNFPEKRVRDTVHGDHYALNTNRMYEITEAYDGNPTMFFFDNPANVKDSGARLKLTDETIDSIIAYADSDHGSEAITLDVFPDNDITEATFEMTLAKIAIAYLYPYGDGEDYTWVVYADGGYDVLRILIDQSFDNLWNELNDTVV